MRQTPPERIAINHDDHHAEFVGRTANGRQFFLTGPFVPSSPNDKGAEFVALYLFDAEGRFLEARIDAFGPRDAMDREARYACVEQRIGELGEIEFGRIEIAPFEVERFGITFGLIANERDDDEDDLSYSVMPGDVMAFYDWESGDYDT